MPLKNTLSQFGAVTKLLHWTIAVLVLAMIPLGFLMDLANPSLSTLLADIHKSCGLTILFLAICMYVWRLINPRPLYPPETPVWQAKLANKVHPLLYILIFIQTLSGWMMTTAAGHPPLFWWTSPLAMPWIPTNQILSHYAYKLHNISIWVLMAVIILHIIGAFYHKWIRRDGIFERMQPQFTQKKRYYD